MNFLNFFKYFNIYEDDKYEFILKYLINIMETCDT